MLRYTLGLTLLVIAFDTCYLQDAPTVMTTTQSPDADKKNNSIFVIDSRVPHMQYEVDAVEGLKLAHALHPYDNINAVVKALVLYLQDKQSGHWKTVVGSTYVYIPSEQDYYITLYDGLLRSNLTVIL